MAARYPWFVRRDLDGFFGLFVDNLVQLLVIIQLTALLAGLETDFILRRILPGAAVSVFVGNLFYSWQAHRLARATGRTDVTALPYGINTPSVFAYLYFIMMPVFNRYQAEVGREAAALMAWRAGLVACLGSGLIEFFGSFVAGWIRRRTPRAALLCALAGIAVGFISMDFALQIFERPMLALLPMAIILMQYFSGVRLPLGLPAGLTAILVGTALGWGLKGLVGLGAFNGFGPWVRDQAAWEASAVASADALRAALQTGWFPPVPALDDLWLGLRECDLAAMLGVVVPMGLFNVIGSLQNIESAEAAGDRYPTRSSLAVNGLGTLAACVFGSCFPTTIYIGHPGWKRLGARTGYSALNGVVITICCVAGVIRAVNVLVPTVTIVGILIWIAIIIGAQAFQAIPRRHAPAVVLGLFPAIAAWGLQMFKNGAEAAGTPVAGLEFARVPDFMRLGGLIALDRGFIVTSMGWAAIGVYLIDRRFRVAAAWAAVMGLLAFLGIIHAWDPARLAEPATLGWGAGWRFTVAYGAVAALLWALARRAESGPGVSALESELDPSASDTERSGYDG